jgi:hypothetical protein
MCSKGQFYTIRRPDNILWFQGIRQRMGFAERKLGTAVRTPEHPTRRVLIPSSHDLAYLVEPLAIHLDPTEPSGDAPASL